MKHIKVIEKDNWIHITEAKKFESLLVKSRAVPLVYYGVYQEVVS